MNRVFIPICIIGLCSIFLGFSADCQVPHLEKGIELYKQDKYEEAVEFLQKAREQEPTSSAAAFFLGLAYKQQADYQNAATSFRDAVTLTPKIKEALLELIEVLIRLGEKKQLDEAQKWLDVAKEAAFYPAKVAFLEGMMLQKTGEDLKAIEFFEKAKSLDPSFSSSADFQIAISYMNARKLKKAREQLRAVVAYDPQSDLADFARRYQDSVEKRIAYERPVHIIASFSGGYDSNVVLKPSDNSVAPDITGEASYFKAPFARIDFTPEVQSPWIVSASGSFSGKFYDSQVRKTHDLMSYGLNGLAGYNFGQYSLNATANYAYTVRRNPDWETLAHIFGFGPLARMSWRRDHLFELFAGLFTKDYDEPPLVPEEDNDSSGVNAYLNWMWAFSKGAFFTLRYDLSVEDANGSNLDNNSHRFSANVNFPFVTDSLLLQFGTNALIQDYQNIHTIFEKKRKDQIFQAFAGLSWNFYKNFALLAHYNFTRTESNIEIYEYDRHITTLGIEYRY